METSMSLLDQASALWSSCRQKYRDSAIETGKLLHKFVLARLSEASLSEAVRAKDGRTRRTATAIAADRLGVTVPRVNDLIVSAMVVELLSKEGNTGDLSWTEIRCFRLLIRRSKERAARSNCDGGAPPSVSETWLVKDGLETTAPALFRKAVDKAWRIDRVRKEINKLIDPFRLPSAPVVHRIVDEMPSKVPMNLTALAKECGPKDLASLIIEMIRNSKDPVSVMALIEEAISQPTVTKEDWE